MPSRSRLVFLDIGGHLGQTLDEVLSECYAFDRVHTFEPMARFADRLSEVYQPHVDEGLLRVHSFGLSKRNACVTLFGDNDGGGASVHATKDDVGDAQTTQVQMVRATEFFEDHLSEEDRVIVKLNCEGAEGDILIDLIESGRIHWVTNAMIDFDLFKVKGRRHEPFHIMRRLRDVGFDDYHLAIDAMVGPTHADRIRNWLAHVDQQTPVARTPETFAGLPRKRALFKRALRAAKHRALGLLDASPLNRAG